MLLVVVGDDARHRGGLARIKGCAISPDPPSVDEIV